MEYFKEFIKSTIREYLNERYEINNLPSNIVLLSILNNNNTKFMLFDTLTKKPIGCISFNFYPIRFDCRMRFCLLN